ncbi:hypothetical protein NQ315_010565 [Exocentrus adspersus]|uniref:Kazal-like domain-containing protein n=1 Tax=Exocentrus adspersus TaxID=1586481 RepID=A0AAV8W706_9CUCU|nr:hypothetical protein NQ315_010565 [Exocentrus adspersus]
MPPFILYHAKHLWDIWMPDEAFPNTGYAATPHGWMTETAFFNWFKNHFLENCPKERPLLIVLDEGNTPEDCIMAFQNSATCYRAVSHGGNPKNNGFLSHILGNQVQSSLSRQPRQNRLVSSGGNNINQFLDNGLGNSRPNTGGFDWYSNGNSMASGERRRSSQNDFTFQENNSGVDNFLRPNRPRTTQRPSASSTVAIPGMATTRSPCEDNCRATTQFDPVCGDNNVTYTNINWLKCAQQCGRNIRVRYVGACPRVS